MTSPHTFNPTILREYDIRGIVDDTLHAADAFAIGRAYGSMLHLTFPEQQNHVVAIGYDGRASSPIMAQALSDGLKQTGVDVKNIGIGPSPMLYFATYHLETDGGIMITGSHNPASYNGFKMLTKNGSLFGDAIQELGQIAAKGDFENGAGTETTHDIQDDYVTRLIKDFDTNGRDLNIVWDNGNGAAGNILQRLVNDLPGNHHLLYEDIDGSFPNHHPDPTVDSNLTDLIRTVREQKADFGIAFDGDGDRIGVVDQNGNVIRCDALLGLYAKDVLESNPAAKIIADVKCSQSLFNEINRLGGNAIMCPTGHSLVKNTMVRENSPLAGELSGHIFFKDKYYGFDDALYCAVRLINIVASNDAPLSDYFMHLPTLLSTPEIRLEVPEEIKFSMVKDIAGNLKSASAGDFDINEMDGIRISNDAGWCLIRPSNTQNAIVMRVEANSIDQLHSFQSIIESQLKQAGVDYSFDTLEKPANKEHHVA